MANTDAVVEPWPDLWPYGVVIGGNMSMGPGSAGYVDPMAETNNLLRQILVELQKLANPILVKEYVGANPEQFPITEGGYGANQPRFG